MLARRFTVVCLLCALFGMGFANLVAQQAGTRSWSGGMVTPCQTNQGIACTPLAMRSGLPSRRF